MGLRTKYNLTQVRSIPTFTSNGKVFIPTTEIVLKNETTTPGDYYAFPVIAETVVQSGGIASIIHGRSESHGGGGPLRGTYLVQSVNKFQSTIHDAEIELIDGYGTGSIGRTQTGRLILDCQQYVGAEVIKYISFSDDEGANWTPLERLTMDYDGGLIDGPGRPVQYSGGMIKLFYAQETEGSYGPVAFFYTDNGETRVQIGIVYPIDNPANFEEPCPGVFNDNLLLAIIRSDDLALNGCYSFWSSTGRTWSEPKFAFPSVGKSPVIISPNQTVLSLGRLALTRGGTIGLDSAAKKTTIFAHSADRGRNWEWYPLDTRDGGNVYSDGYWHEGDGVAVSVHSVEKGKSGTGNEGADLIIRYYEERDESAVASAISVINNGFCSEAIANINLAYRAGFVLPSQSKLNAWNTFVTWLGTSGILTKADFFKVFQFNDANCQDFGCLDLKDPRKFQATRYKATGANGYPNYSTLGFKTNKLDNYVNLNWDPSINGVKYTLNSACIMIGVSEAPTAGVEVGCFKVTGGTSLAQIGLTAGNFIINSGAPSALTIPVKTGLFAVNRSASNATQSYRNGAEIGNNTQVSVAIPAGEWNLGCRATETITSGQRVNDQFCDSRFELAAAFQSLTPTEHADIQTNWATYKTAIGL